MLRFLTLFILLCMTDLPLAFAQSPLPQPQPQPQHIIIDSDIGGDIDDVFALLVAVRSPELRLDLVTASYGQTGLKARLIQRLLNDAGHPEIPIAQGPETENKDGFALRPWAETSPYGQRVFPPAVDSILARLRSAPKDSIILLAIAPLTTIDAAMQREPATFRRLKKVVLMSGSIYHGYGQTAGTNSPSPTLETNAKLAPLALRHLLASGVPVEMMPLDATEVEMDVHLRAQLFAARPPLGADLHELYREWATASHYGDTPVAFDVVPLARLLNPATCTLLPLHLDISNRGNTLATPGKPNASVCLSVDKQIVINLIAHRIK